MCGVDLPLAHDDDDDGDIDDDENDDDDGKEPSWKLYVATAFCLVDDCSSAATVEGDSAMQSLCIVIVVMVRVAMLVMLLSMIMTIVIMMLVLIPYTFHSVSESGCSTLNA